MNRNAFMHVMAIQMCNESIVAVVYTTVINKIKKYIVSKFFSSTPESLITSLKDIGIAQGETLFVHSSWTPNNGFRGSPVEFIKAIQSVITPKGKLVMPSLTYQQ